MPGVRGRRATAGRDEAGFTLVEVLVSVALVAATMAALAVFFGASTSAARHHGDLQRATQFAVAAVERVAQADGPAILAGRTQAAVTSQPQVPGVAGYLTGQQMVLVWADRNAPATTPLLPTTPQPVTVGGTATKFTRSWYVGKCWQPVGGGRCTVVPPGSGRRASPSTSSWSPSPGRTRRAVPARARMSRPPWWSPRPRTRCSAAEVAGGQDSRVRPTAPSLSSPRSAGPGPAALRRRLRPHLLAPLGR
jgi:prepilin-type N-terminal cleavage/methylation domain-containing protein